MARFFFVLPLCITLFISCNQAEIPHSQDNVITVTILHTNDIHGHLDNLPRLVTAVNLERDASSPDSTLLLDAGDIFSGSVYGTLYQGQASLWFMNYLGYDAVCLGNHEFDAGLDALEQFVDGAEFHVVTANVGFPGDRALQDTITPYVVVERNGARYGIFGLLTEETTGYVPASTVTVHDYLTAARSAVAALEGEGINKIIALTHLGWDNDLRLAGEVGDIDIIIGGHTHTIPDKYPFVVDNDGSPTLVVQAGQNAEYLGSLNLVFDENGVLSDWTGSRLIKVNETLKPDAASSAKLAEYRVPIEKMMSTTIGSTLVDLNGERASVRSGETNLGNLVADSMLSKADYDGTDIALISGGGIRASIPRGDITLADVINVLPFDDYLVSFNLTGAQLVAALENGLSKVEETEGRFPQVAGLRFVWDPHAPAGNRIVSVEVEAGGGYRPIDYSEIYRVVTNNFLYGGGDGYTIFAEGTDFINLGFTDYEVLAEYITANSPISPQTEGRISRK